MRVLFLDFDGVLSPRMTSAWDNGNFPGRVAKSHIRRAITVSDCKVVITSNWRKNCFSDNLVNMLYETKVISDPSIVIGETDYLNYQAHRGDEIVMWLNNNPGVESFVILDDKDNAIRRYDKRQLKSFGHYNQHDSKGSIDQSLRERFVFCNPKIGCSKEDADRIIKLFEESK